MIHAKNHSHVNVKTRVTCYIALIVLLQPNEASCSSRKFCLMTFQDRTLSFNLSDSIVVKLGTRVREVLPLWTQYTEGLQNFEGNFPNLLFPLVSTIYG